MIFILKMFPRKRRFHQTLFFLIIILIFLLIWIKYLNKKSEFLLIDINERSLSSPSSIFSLKHRNIERWKELKNRFKQINMSLLILPRPIPLQTITFQCTSICGGLGDRIRGLIMAYFLSILSNRRLVVDMYWPCNFNDYFEGNMYKWISSSDINLKGNWFYIHAIDSNDILINELKTSSFIDTWSEYSNIQISTNIDLISLLFENPYLQSNPIIKMFLQNMSPEEANIQTLFPLFYEILLRPTDRIVRSIDQLMRNRSNQKLICTHLRIGRNPSNPRDSPFEYSRNITKKVIHFISKNKFLDKNSFELLFVSSDSISATKEITNYFFNRSFFVPGPVLQIDLPVDNVNCNDGFTKVVMDFYLLSECETVILTNSGFSAFANRRRKDPYHNLYKYNQKNNQIEKCLDFRSPQGWEHPRSINTKLYCPIYTNNFTIDEIP